MNVSKCSCLRFGPRTLQNCSTGPSPYSVGGEVINFTESHPDLGVLINRKLKFHGHVQKTANKCNALITNILSSTLCRDPEFLLSIFKSLIRPNLEYGSCLWNYEYLGDTRALERIQRRWTRKVDRMQSLPYSERLQQLDLFSVQGRLLRADMILTWKIFNQECAINLEQIFILDRSPTRGHSRKLFLPRVNLDTRKRFFAVRVISTWNSLSNDTVNAVTLNKFKSLLHRDLGQRLYAYLD